MFISKALLNKPCSRNTEIVDNPILDSSFGSASAWYRGGPRFESWQSESLFQTNLNTANMCRPLRLQQLLFIEYTFIDYILWKLRENTYFLPTSSVGVTIKI